MTNAIVPDKYDFFWTGMANSHFCPGQITKNDLILNSTPENRL